LLLGPILFLPLVHVHYVSAHAHDGAENHLHQATLHTDFSSVNKHDDDHHIHEHNSSDHHETEDAHEEDHIFDSTVHSLSQFDYSSLHSGSSFSLSSFYKKELTALIHETPDPPFSLFLQYQGLISRQIPPHQELRFVPPSLRAPPYFA